MKGRKVSTIWSIGRILDSIFGETDLTDLQLRSGPAPGRILTAASNDSFRALTYCWRALRSSAADADSGLRFITSGKIRLTVPTRRPTASAERTFVKAAPNYSKDKYIFWRSKPPPVGSLRMSIVTD